MITHSGTADPAYKEAPNPNSTSDVLEEEQKKKAEEEQKREEEQTAGDNS